MALKHVFLWVLQFSLVNIIPLKFHLSTTDNIHIKKCQRNYITWLYMSLLNFQSDYQQLWLRFHVTFGRPQNCEKQLLALSSVCPPVRMEQFVFHWTDFREIWYSSIFRKSVQKYLSIFRKSVEKSQVPLQFDNNNCTLHEHLGSLMICRWILLKIGNVSNKSVEKKHTFYVQLLFPQNSAVYETTWKNILQPDKSF